MAQRIHAANLNLENNQMINVVLDNTTTVSRGTLGGSGSIIYDTSKDNIAFYDGTKWVYPNEITIVDNTAIVQVNGVSHSIMPINSSNSELDFSITNTTISFTIKEDVVTNDKLAEMEASTFKGAVVTGDPVDLNIDETKKMLGIDRISNTSDTEKIYTINNIYEKDLIAMMYTKTSITGLTGSILYSEHKCGIDLMIQAYNYVNNVYKPVEISYTIQENGTINWESTVNLTNAKIVVVGKVVRSESDVDEDLYYGIRYIIGDKSADPIIERIGNMDYHINLPIHNKMYGGLFAADGTCAYKLGGPNGDLSWNETDNKGFLRAGLNNDGTVKDVPEPVMIYLPKYYYKCENKYLDGKYVREIKISEYPIRGYNIMNDYLYSAYGGNTYGTSTGGYNSSSYMYTSLRTIITPEEKDNNGLNVAAYTRTNSVLVVPGTSYTTLNDKVLSYNGYKGYMTTHLRLIDYANNAKLRGPGWNGEIYQARKSYTLLYFIEFANLNVQDTYHSDLTSSTYYAGTYNGTIYPSSLTTSGTKPSKNFNASNSVFRYGGLGYGVSSGSDTWSYYPIIPNGATDELGDGTGVVVIRGRQYNQSSFVCDGVTYTNAQPVPRYRGIENPYGHIWSQCDYIRGVYDSEHVNISTTSNTTYKYDTQVVTISVTTSEGESKIIYETISITTSYATSSNTVITTKYYQDGNIRLFVHDDSYYPNDSSYNDSSANSIRTVSGSDVSGNFGWKYIGTIKEDTQIAQWKYYVDIITNDKESDVDIVGCNMQGVASTLQKGLGADGTYTYAQYSNSNLRNLVRLADFGGRAGDGGYCGLLCSDWDYPVSYRNPYRGSRLAFSFSQYASLKN